jgi:hypothetical protein
MKPVAFAAFAVLAVLPALAAAHGDKLDAYGCHKARGAGGYHCHMGVFAGRSFPSQEAMQMALAERKGGKKRRP